jgi:hypothetical protein
MTPYITAEGNEWQLQSYYEAEDQPATEDVKFILNDVNDVSELVFFKSGLACQ